MTPAAITPAGRSTAKRGKPNPTPARIVNPAGAPSVPGHRRRLAPQAAPKLPRRVSGPAPRRSAGITHPRQGGGIALPRPGWGGIAKPRSRPTRRTTRPGSQSLPLPRRLLGAIWALPDHPLLDRVVRGRAWIALLGVMLAGIVAMQIEVLKLGASIGRSLQRGSSLQSRNQQLQAGVAKLGDDARIERLAATMGMVMPAPDGVGFVTVGGALLSKAIANIHQPNTASFLSLTVPNGAVTGFGPSTASGALGDAPGAGATGASATASAGVPTTGTSSPTEVSGTTGSPGVTTQTAATATQPAGPPASSVSQTTSPASSATGAAGTVMPAPTQSSPGAVTGGAGVPAG